MIFQHRSAIYWVAKRTTKCNFIIIAVILSLGSPINQVPILYTGDTMKHLCFWEEASVSICVHHEKGFKGWP